MKTATNSSKWGSVKLIVPSAMVYTTKTGITSKLSPLTPTGNIARKDGVPAIQLIKEDQARRLTRKVLRHRPDDYSELLTEIDRIVEQSRKQPKSEFETYFEKLRDKIEEKNMGDFWVRASDGNPEIITNKSMAALRALIERNKTEYAGTLMANVQITFRPRIDFARLRKDQTVLTINIEIFSVGQGGEINTSIADSWSLMIQYTSEELLQNKFSIQELQHMIKVAASKKIVTDIGGMSIGQYKKRLVKVSK